MEPIKLKHINSGEEFATLSRAVDKAEPGQNIIYCETAGPLPSNLKHAAEALHMRGLVSLVQRPTGPASKQSRRFQYIMQVNKKRGRR